MAGVALDPAYRRISVEELLDMDFGGAKAELEDGLIYMMAGGGEAHARIAANLIIALGTRLRGTGCHPYGSGSGFATQTAVRPIRFPQRQRLLRPSCGAGECAQEAARRSAHRL